MSTASKLYGPSLRSVKLGTLAEIPSVVSDDLVKTLCQKRPIQRTNYHLNENYCRSIPEHYRQGNYGRMSEIGCFAMNNEEQLEWEECSVPSCEQFCSPYPDCDITECLNDDGASGVHYRTDTNAISRDFGILRNKKEISQTRGKLAITKWGENCFPWEEVVDSQIGFDFYGRQTTSFIKRYRLFFETTKILSNHCHLVIIHQIYMALMIIFAVILTHIPGGALGAG